MQNAPDPKPTPAPRRMASRVSIRSPRQCRGPMPQRRTRVPHPEPLAHRVRHSPIQRPWACRLPISHSPSSPCRATRCRRPPLPKLQAAELAVAIGAESSALWFAQAMR